ncbi:GNAT family N-acetyltransferase [Shewanella bicestrii]
MNKIEINPSLIKELLEKVDNEFQPRLSSKVNLTEYACKLNDKAVLFVELDKEILIGLCAVYMSDRIQLQAYLSMLAVDPEYRGKGFAKKLILDMESTVKDNGFKIIRLEVYKTNKGALSMYLKLNYIIIDSTENSFFLQKVF